MIRQANDIFCFARALLTAARDPDHGLPPGELAKALKEGRVAITIDPRPCS